MRSGLSSAARLATTFLFYCVLAHGRQAALVPTTTSAYADHLNGPQPLGHPVQSVQPSLFAPGSIYRSEMSVPVLGPQSFVLKILDDTTARIWIRGVLKLDDSIEYTVDEATRKISFVLTDKTKRLLRRFGTRLGSVGYDPDRDEARLEVQPPLPMSITLFFQRVLSPGKER